MSKTTRPGAGNGKPKEYPCDWKPKGDHKHVGSKKPFSLSNDGNTDRGEMKSIPPPHSLFNSNTPTKTRIRYTTKKGIIHTKAQFYPTEKHHVIPVGSLNKIKHLPSNLKLLGFDINKNTNGIKLPKYDQDIFWQDLPRHNGYNATHSTYNTQVKSDLDKKYKAGWKNFCKNDCEGDLLEEIQEYIDDVRNQIIQWKSKYFVFKNGGDRDSSFKKAGLISMPPNKTRKYQ
jgi:hypothetical protein